VAHVFANESLDGVFVHRPCGALEKKSCQLSGVSAVRA